MAENEFSIPTCVKTYITKQGYEIDESMVSYINDWWNWYTGSSSWYEITWKLLDGSDGERQRLSLRPHKRAAKEWASLLLNEDTTISVDAANANEWLAEYLNENAFWPNGQNLIEKAWAIGTGAWALHFKIEEEATDSRIRIRRYDARMIVPLTYDDEGVTECAFVSQVVLKGKKAHQLQMHVMENGAYIIKTALFVNDKPVSVEEYGVMAEFNTECPEPTFAIVKPGTENTVVDLSPFGMSVSADAIDAAKSVDMTYDALFQEIKLTEAIVFLSDEMIDVRDVNGKVVPVANNEADSKFRKLEGQDGTNLYEVYSPSIRTDPIKQALDVALAEFGDLTGFGQNYFTIDKAGGLKTATEVASDNSALMRNVKKHENSLRRSIQTIITSLLICARIHCGAKIEDDPGVVHVEFDDSIITDTQAEKNQMLAEIAAGVRPKWHYLVEFDGMAEEEAKELIPDSVIDMGLDALT